LAVNGFKNENEKFLSNLNFFAKLTRTKKYFPRFCQFFKTGLNGSFFSAIQNSGNDLIFGKQFQKRPNGNPFKVAGKKRGKS